MSHEWGSNRVWEFFQFLGFSPSSVYFYYSVNGTSSQGGAGTSFLLMRFSYHVPGCVTILILAYALLRGSATLIRDLTRTRGTLRSTAVHYVATTYASTHDTKPR